MNQIERPWPGALTTSEAARIVWRTPQALSKAIRSGALKATKVGTGIRAPYFIDIMDLRETYPPDVVRPGKRLRAKWTNWRDRVAERGWTVRPLTDEEATDASG